MAETSSLLNCQTRKGLAGSNPAPSAKSIVIGAEDNSSCLSMLIKHDENARWVPRLKWQGVLQPIRNRS